VNKVEVKFPQSKIVLIVVLRGTDVSWRSIGVEQDTYEWRAKTLGVTFIESNSWCEDWNFGSDRLYMNLRGARRLIELYCRLVDCMVRKGDGLTAVVERL
jgi:hypothetical protein